VGVYGFFNVEGVLGDNLCSICLLYIPNSSTKIMLKKTSEKMKNISFTQTDNNYAMLTDCL